MSEDQTPYLTRAQLYPINCHDRLDSDEDLGQDAGELTQDTHDMNEIISRLRNRNVAQLLDDLGDQPPCVVRSIKRQFTRFANDTIQEIQDNDNSEPNRNG